GWGRRTSSATDSGKRRLLARRSRRCGFALYMRKQDAGDTASIGALHFCGSTSLATHWLVLSFHKGIENYVGLLDRQARVHAIDERFHGATCGLRPDPTYVPLIATHAP